MNQENKEDCCPEFNPEKWDEKSFNWDKKQFIRESIPTLFHIPFPPMIGKKITKMWKAAEESGKNIENKEEALVLFTDPNPFKSEIYLSVTGEVPDAKNIPISGVFISKVFDGPYNAIPKFMAQMDKYLSGRGNKAKKYYVHYAYCPKCAKEKGHNHMILFAEV
ncbi:hydrolase [Patescibacteria group bacterium]